jgi:hypothetical protein
MSTSIHMPRGRAITSATALLTATVVGGLAVLLPGVPEVKAAPPSEAAVHQVLAKSDRLPLLATGAACSSLAWPNYEQACQFDMRRRGGELRPVRIIALR